MFASEDFDIAGFSQALSQKRHLQIKVPIVRHRRLHTHHALLIDDIYSYHHVPSPITVKKLDARIKRGEATPLKKLVRAFPGAVVLFVSDELKLHADTEGKIREGGGFEKRETGLKCRCLLPGRKDIRPAHANSGEL